MNVSSLSNSMSGISSTYATQATPQVPTDGSDDGTGQVQGHRGHGHGHGHGGGGMKDALTNALDSIGLTVPAGATTPTPPPGGATDADDTTGTATATNTDSSSIQSDMKQFMRALAQAVQGEPSSSSSSASDPKAGFAGGLSALLSQVAGGQAPQPLQDAFTKLATDLTASDATSSSSSSSSTTTGQQPTLQALLTQLQQTIGYSGNSGTQAVGNLLSAQV